MKKKNKLKCLDKKVFLTPLLQNDNVSLIERAVNFFLFAKIVCVKWIFKKVIAIFFY